VKRAERIRVSKICGPSLAISLCFLLSLAAFPRQEPSAAGNRPVQRVPRVEGSVKIDARLDEPAWSEALVIDLDTEVEPGENIAPPVRTEVLLCYDQGKFYAAFRAHDPDPSAIRARYTDRDQIYEDDWVGIILDTFDDARRSYDFLCNPLGIQSDMVEVSGGGGGTAWDAIWDSAGRITDEGYVVEMAIPFSSLRFQRSEGDQVWGFDAVRSYPRTVRHHIGCFPRERGNNCYLCQAEKIVGFAGADPGRNLEFDPTVAALYSEERDGFPDGPFVKKDGSVDPGLTVRWSLTPNLTLGAAVNPDFSQVEADAAQLDINTQFALYYPEKRPFFLEGADFFSTQIGAVHTRTLADPAWGVKVSGKVGRGAIGYFTVRDEVTNLLLPSSQYSMTTTLGTKNTGSVFRYRHDVGKSSTIGMLASNREGSGYSNRLFGLDGTLRFTSKDTLLVQALGSRTRYPSDTAEAFGQPEGTFSGEAFDLMYVHNTRTWETYVHYMDFGEHFRADLGFVPQVGYSFFDTGVLRNWYQDQPNHWYNHIRAWVGYELTRDARKRMLREVYGTLVEYGGPKESSGSIIVYIGKQRFMDEEFDHNTFRVSATFQPLRDLELGLILKMGDAVDYAHARQAKRLRIRPAMELFAGLHLRLELAHDYDRLWVREGRLYTAHLTELRAVYQFTSRAFFRAILQRADYRFEEDVYRFLMMPREKSLLSQFLFSYKVNPQTALYLGYSDNYLGNHQVGLTQTDRAVFFKIGYAWVL